jgi:hypothetical protein
LIGGGNYLTRKGVIDFDPALAVGLSTGTVDKSCRHAACHDPSASLASRASIAEKNCSG